MNYTILSATFANEDNSAAEIITPEAGSVLVSEKDHPAFWPLVLAVPPAAYQRPRVALQPTPLEKLRAFLKAHPDVLAALEEGGVSPAGNHPQGG